MIGEYDGVFAVPVKYMVVRHWLQGFAIIDTSLEGLGKRVCSCGTIDVAHHLAKLMNNDEGYEYAPCIG